MGAISVERLSPTRGNGQGCAAAVGARLALRFQLRARGGEGGALFVGYLGDGEIEPAQRLVYRGDDDQPGEPFVVGRHDEPRRVRRRGRGDRLLVGVPGSRPSRRARPGRWR